jgi:3-dehydroquinate synthase
MIFSIDGKRLGVAPKTLRDRSYTVKSRLRDCTVTFHKDWTSPGNETGGGNPVYVVDKKVLRLHGRALNLPSRRVLEFEASEQSKNLRGAQRIWDFLLDKNISRKDTIVAIGGGVTLDTAGFAAACFKRGVLWAAVPTTLLAMCDSCMGGKTGINYGAAKNQLGAFYPPSSIHIHPGFAATLSQTELRSGLGETLKACVIGGQPAIAQYDRFFDAAINADGTALEKLVRVALGVKKAVVEADEFESGPRRALNYGHTVGHALEVISGYKIPHGIAVLWGMCAVNEYARGKGLASEKDCAGLRSRCAPLTDGISPARFSSAQLLELMRRDKKATGAALSLMLPKAPGRMITVQVPLTESFAREINEILCEL